MDACASIGAVSYRILHLIAPFPAYTQSHSRKLPHMTRCAEIQNYEWFYE
ncbi:hypothetical protein GCM10009504_33320 [Pseudomonas laurentiana]|nr:hypothetical protein GCM10009504_33320 [Pseudomonas laurentiana]